MNHCCICGKALPNSWAVGKTETVGEEVRYYCHLHASGASKAGPRGGSTAAIEPETEPTSERTPGMSEASKTSFPSENNSKALEEREHAIARGVSRELARKAWTECAALAAKLGGGIKAIWSKLHPDRSPEATLISLDADLKENRSRLEALRPELEAVYRQIVAKKKDYQGAPPARQRLLKVELQSLLARYKGLEREFAILSENERSIETVKSRFLEILAYGRRGRVNEDMVDRLADDVDDAAENAEGIQDALADLERSGKRKERGDGDFDAALAEFDGELGLAENEPAAEAGDENLEANKENGDQSDETDTIEPRVGDGDWN